MKITKKQRERLGMLWHCCWVTFIAVIFFKAALIIRSCNVDPGFKLVSLTILLVGAIIVFLMFIGDNNEKK